MDFSNLQANVQGFADAVDGIGNLVELTAKDKSSLASAINEVNNESVDDALSKKNSTLPVEQCSEKAKTAIHTILGLRTMLGLQEFERYKNQT